MHNKNNIHRWKKKIRREFLLNHWNEWNQLKWWECSFDSMHLWPFVECKPIHLHPNNVLKLPKISLVLPHSHFQCAIALIVFYAIVELSGFQNACVDSACVCVCFFLFIRKSTACLFACRHWCISNDFTRNSMRIRFNAWLEIQFSDYPGFNASYFFSSWLNHALIQPNKFHEILPKSVSHVERSNAWEKIYH